MVQDLFVNTCILITIIFVSSQIFRNSGLSMNSRTEVRVVLGLIGGITASILIHFCINITDEVILDLRDMCFIIVATFGGMFSVIITGLITATFRMLYQGLSSASLLAALEVIMACTICGLLAYIKCSQKIKAYLMFAVCLTLRSVFYFILMEDVLEASKTVISLWIYSIIVGFGVYYLMQYIVTTHQALKSLKKASTVDYLTGLNNYRQFDLKLKSSIDQTIEDHKKLALLIIDLDYFKNINDTFGHPAGDAVLKELGKLLKIICRSQYIISRVGGEEFAVLIREKSKEEVRDIAETIRTTIKNHKFILPDNKKVHITASIGAAVYPDTLSNIQDLKEVADAKLYEAKRSGRNRVCI